MMNIGKVPGGVGKLARQYLAWYLPAREFVTTHWMWLLPVGLVLLVALLFLFRAFLLWRNKLVAKLAGADLDIDIEKCGFPKKRFDLLNEVKRAPEGKYFVGCNPKGRPIYLTEWDLDTHGHIMGHTGSGKTRSVLEPLMFQDMRAGKGLLFMDAKGSSENVDMFKAVADLNGRRGDLRVFALAHPQWSHTYNPVYVTGLADPLVTAERVFSVFDLQHEYYRGQSKLFFYNLIRLLASTGLPFNLVDVRLCVADDVFLHYAYDLADDRAAKFEIDKQLKQLGKRRMETFTGLYNALAEYDHPLLNSYNPDIVIEDVMNERQVVYFNLPANRYALLAPAIGKIVLQHIKAVGAMRQISRARYDQNPFAVCVDELNRFAFEELVPSLAMLRDARVQFRLAHQSLGDLEQVSRVFSQQVQDNTRWKMHLYENDPDHLEKVCRSYGTRTTYKKTVRYKLGPLFTFLNTGESSNREVEALRLHPNQPKSLAPCGQAYLLQPDRVTGLNLEPLPRFAIPEYELPKNGVAAGLDLANLFVTSRTDDCDDQDSSWPSSDGVH
ncbi:type IV secretory system conjugative DNA transfer family protein [Myxococcota bacterium]